MFGPGWAAARNCPAGPDGVTAESSRKLSCPAGRSSFGPLEGLLVGPKWLRLLRGSDVSGMLERSGSDSHVSSPMESASAGVPISAVDFERSWKVGSGLVTAESSSGSAGIWGASKVSSCWRPDRLWRAFWLGGRQPASSGTDWPLLAS